MILSLVLSVFTVLSDTPDSLVIRYRGDYSKYEVEGRFFIELDQGDYPEENGKPALPFIRKRILIPAGCRLDYRYTIESRESFKGIPTLIHKYGEKISEEKPESYIPKPVILRRNTPSPGGNATVEIYPFSFDGDYIEFRNSILITVYFKGGEWIYPTGYQSKHPSLFLNKMRGRRVSIKRLPRAKAGLWMKVKTTRDGIHEITPADIEAAGLNPSSIDPEMIEVRHGYTHVMKWSMDSISSLDSISPLIPAIYEMDNDGIFEQGERILFYAHRLSGWGRNYFRNDKYFYYNPYADTNVYWLVMDGNPALIEEESLTGGTQGTYFIDTVHLEEDRFSPLKSGLVWVWEELSTHGGSSLGSMLSIPFSVHNPYDDNAIIKVGFYPVSSGQYIFRLNLNGLSKYDTVYSTGTPARERTTFIDTINAISSGSNQLEITLETSDESIMMDYVEVFYKRRMSVYNGKLHISSDTGILRSYSVDNLSSDPYVLNISNTEFPYLVTHQYSSGSIDFSSDSERILIQELPYSINGISIKDPTSLLTGGADWFVIAPSEFLSAAYELKNWREKNLRGFTSPICKVIKLEDIYNNFSFGVTDPTAMKRFLNHANNIWSPQVSYVLLYGDGSYDYKNLSGIGKSSFIPVHTKGTYIQQGGYLSVNDCWDNWFSDFNEDNIQDIPIGRITAANLNEATKWVDKLIEYESNSGEWRRNVILLSDDAFIPNYNAYDAMHTVWSENYLCDNLPGWLYKEKVYLMEYPRVGNEKPEAEEAHLRYMENGALIAFFLGHGNLRRLTHESVFLIQDIKGFNNWRKVPFYFFGSCNVGYFERPDEDCIGGYSVLYDRGGCIASIASGRATSYEENPRIGRELINYIFSDSVKTVGDAFLFSKERVGNKTFTLFGDPASTIVLDTSQLNTVIPDSAIGGEGFVIKGDVFTSSSKIFCLVTESDYDTVLDAREGSGTPYYIDIKKTGRKLFDGSSSIDNDSFSVLINLPVNIDEDSGFVYLYSRGDREAHGRYPIKFFSGTGIGDTVPPSVEFYIKGRKLRLRDIIPPSGEMTVVLKDTSGIDLRENINLQVVVEDNAPLYLTDKFKYHTGSATIGEASFTYEEPLFSDSISFTVYAKDNAGNVANSMATFKLADEEIIWGVENYPNPMKDRTTIIYHLGREVNVDIRIFTIAGRLVKRINPGISRYGVNYAEWNGRDEKGRLVSNGIYYYVVKPGDGEPVYGKIAVIR